MLKFNKMFWPFRTGSKKSKYPNFLWDWKPRFWQSLVIPFSPIAQHLSSILNESKAVFSQVWNTSPEAAWRTSQEVCGRVQNNPSYPMLPCKHGGVETQAQLSKVWETLAWIYHNLILSDPARKPPLNSNVSKQQPAFQAEMSQSKIQPELPN